MIFRSPARFRGQRPPGFAVSVDWDPATTPTTLSILYANNAGQFRKYWFRGFWTPDYILDLANRLSHGLPGTPRGGWLFNEQVVQQLFNVTLV